MLVAHTNTLPHSTARPQESEARSTYTDTLETPAPRVISARTRGTGLTRVRRVGRVTHVAGGAWSWSLPRRDATRNDVT